MALKECGITNLGLSDVAHLPQLTGVVGTSRNAKMSVTTASATATFTADELIVQTALGGRQYKLISVNKTINLATTGAGGMDTGVAPTSGYVALYAIYNPTIQASALLAVNASSVIATEVYSGASMPAGYTASALVSVWGIDTSQFKIGYQRNRNIVRAPENIYTTTTGVGITTPTFLNIATLPFNAVGVELMVRAVQTSPGIGVALDVMSSSSSIGRWGATASVTSYQSDSKANGLLHIIESRTIYIQAGSAANGGYYIYAHGYNF
ncbi:hypothetical protein ACQIBV_003101 [Yersinia enterocolitica]